MVNHNYIIRKALNSDYKSIGQIMVDVYSELEGFPSREEQPEYYSMLANIGKFSERPATNLFIAVSSDGRVLGGVVYFSDMQYYGSGGTATQERNACGFRLLAVDPVARGKGVGRALMDYCLEVARKEGQIMMIIHSTKAMKVAWKMYDKIGFKRSEDLDFTG